MLRVAEQYAGTDTGRQRRANEDSLLARSPLFVVADGMGGAQAGEVASRIAVESFEPGLADASHPELELAALARAANARIYELSRANAEQAGMGTTLTAAYVGEHEVAIAHVGDSRAYCLRDGQLLRLTDDHSLVDELMRQGRLTPEEAIGHPQRSVITRALGPEGMVEVDTRSFRARADDLFLLCSDGLTTMISEEQIAQILLANARLHDAGEALIAAANQAGGRDNITVVLIRLEEVSLAQPPPAAEDATMVELPAVSAPGTAQAPSASPASSRGPSHALGASPALSPEPSQALGASPALSSEPDPGRHGLSDGGVIVSAPPRVAPAIKRTPRQPRAAPPGAAPARRRLRIRHAGALAFVLVVLGLLGSAGYLALQSVYFVGTNNRGLITLFQGLPYRLPGNLALYSSQYVSGVGASTLSREQRHKLLNHALRSEGNAGALIRSLELGQVE
jgi:PPM family protein phosphatase